MSTLDECVAAGLLGRCGGNLGPRQQPNRLLAAGVDVLRDMKARLPGMTTDNYFPSSLRPLEQAAILFNHFVAGEDFDPPVPHEMDPKGHGVWRLRTADLRFDGWFPDYNFFVIGAFDSKARSMIEGRNDAMLAEVLALRQATNLNGGRFVNSEDYRDLVRL